MELIYGENFQYSFPHTTYYEVDRTRQDDPLPALPDTATLVMFILSGEGLDDGFLEFSGSTALRDFDEAFGDLNTKKYGLMMEFARKHIIAGGRLIARRLTAEDAALANALYELEISEKTDVTFYLDDTGAVFESQNDAGDLEEVVVSSYEFNTLIKHIASVQNSGELDVTAALDMDDSLPAAGSPAVLPIYGFSVLGRGKFGNAYQIILNDTIKDAQGYPLKNYMLADMKTGNVIDDYEVSHVPDLTDNDIPVAFDTVINNYSAKLGVTMYEDNYELFNDLFEDMIDEVITNLNALTTTNPITNLVDRLNELKTFVSLLDESFLNNLDLFSDSIFPEEEGINLNLIFPNNIDTNITLAEGSDGELAKMKRFDWEYENATGDKVVEKLFADAWSGAIDPVLFDIQKVSGDIILDPGYPTVVKEAISGLVKKSRLDMLYLAGVPVTAKTIDMLETWNMTFNPENQQMMKLGETVPYRSDDNGKIYRVPISILLYLNLIDHYMNGFKEPFAGDNVYISGIESDNILPSINTLDDKQRMDDMNFNIVSRDSDGIFLNGQMTNIIGQYSKLKEAFNIMIKGRIIKYYVPLLEARKHKLDTPQNIESVRRELEELMNDRFGGKCAKIQVEAYFKNEQEEARGDVTMALYWWPNGSIKRYRAYLYTMPKEKL
jgi:hypothetical protein